MLVALGAMARCPAARLSPAAAAVTRVTDDRQGDTARRAAASRPDRKARGIGQAGRADGLWGVLQGPYKRCQALMLPHKRVA